MKNCFLNQEICFYYDNYMPAKDSLCRSVMWYEIVIYGAQADPTQALNVPVIPIGAILAAAHPLANRPPYVLSWLNTQISAQDMMHPELFEKLVLNNFCK